MTEVTDFDMLPPSQCPGGGGRHMQQLLRKYEMPVKTGLVLIYAIVMAGVITRLT